LDRHFDTNFCYDHDFDSIFDLLEDTIASAACVAKFTKIIVTPLIIAAFVLNDFSHDFIISSNYLLCNISTNQANSATALDHPVELLILLNLLNSLECDILKSLNDITMSQSVPSKSDQHSFYGTK
jgi:hypothetical protein